MELTDLRTRFRDDNQRRRTQMVIHDCLADDRLQEECRYLLKFFWQLAMPYREVSMSELEMHLAPEKLERVKALIHAATESPDEIDSRIDETLAAFPIIEDRGFWAGVERWR